MSDAARSVAGRRWRSWSERSRVEVVTLYTRGSLLLVLALTNVAVLSVAVGAVDDATERAGLLVGGAAVSAAGLWALSRLIDRYRTPRPVPALPVATLLAASVLLAAFAVARLPADGRTGALSAIVVAASLTLGVLPSQRVAAGVVAGAGVLAALSTAASGGVTAGAVAYGMLVSAAFVITSRLSMWIVGIVRDLDAARHAQGELAVMEERLRFSRDVHDVMGRHLSTIAVGSELAATLAGRGDERAAAQMLEVRETAHQALREARELARGYRATSFAQEVEGARALLRSAGIAVEVQVETMPSGWQEPAGWVIREGVTNVLRHSRATRVAVAFDGGRLSLENDGVDADGADHDVGAGLRGLRERLEPLGATLATERRSGGRWTIVATLPGSGPLGARVAAEGLRG